MSAHWPWTPITLQWKGRLWSDRTDVESDLHEHCKSTLSVGFCSPVQFIIVSILIYKFPKQWFEQTKADPKCPEIGYEVSKNRVRVDFGWNVQGPITWDVTWCGVWRNAAKGYWSTRTLVNSILGQVATYFFVPLFTLIYSHTIPLNSHLY